MTPTTLVNLALSKIGQTLIKTLGDTNSKESRLASLHYEPTLREALRAHFWGFALCTRPLVRVDTRVYLSVSGPLRVGSKNIEFPRLYLKDTPFNDHVRYDEILDADDNLSIPSSAFWAAFDDAWTLMHGPTMATWVRPIDVPGPEMVTLRPSTPVHFLETSLTGANNDLLFEQKDQTKAPVSIQYNAPVPALLPLVQVNDRTIIVTPAIQPVILDTAFAGTNNNLRFTQADVGTPPTIQFVMDGSGSNSVTVTGRAILVHLRQNFGAFYLTASQVRDLIMSNVFASGLVSVGFPPGQSGTGVVCDPATTDISFGPTPLASAGVSSALQVQAAINSNPDALALVGVSLAPGSTGTGPVAAMPRLTLSGGATGEPVLARVDPSTEFLGWLYAFELPGDFIKAKSLYPLAGGRKIDKFAFRKVAGKPCLLCNHPEVSLEYVQFSDDPTSFDPLFVSAFVTLLAAKLARAITGSDDMESKFLQIYETVDLPAARTASGQESDSNENHPLREFLDGNLTPGRGDFFGRND